MIASGKFSISLIFVFFLFSCQSKEEKRKLDVSDKAKDVFYSAIIVIRHDAKHINSDSLVDIYKNIESKNVDSALSYAYKVKDFTKSIIDSVEVVNDSLDKLRQVKIEKEQAIAKKNWDNSKAGKIQKKHPYWSEEDCKNLAERRIWIGMSYDMLIFLRGRPNHINPSNYGDGVNYQWCWDDHTPSCFYGGSDGIITSYN